MQCFQGRCCAEGILLSVILFNFLVTLKKYKTPLNLNQKDVYEKIVRLIEANGGFRTL